MNGAILQQVFVVEYVVQYQMCDDCHRVEAKDFWKAVVQVRQKVGSVKPTCRHFKTLGKSVLLGRGSQVTPSWKPSNAGIMSRDLFKFLHGHWHAVLIWQTVHKKTFYYLEQLILKHKLHQNSLNIKEIHGRSNFILSPACPLSEGPARFHSSGALIRPTMKKTGPGLLRWHCN